MPQEQWLGSDQVAGAPRPLSRRHRKIVREAGAGGLGAYWVIPPRPYAVSRSAADASPPRMQSRFRYVRARRQRPARPSPGDQSEPEPAAPPPTIKRPYHGRPDFSVPDEQSLAVAMATARHRGRPPAGEVRTPSWLDRRGNVAPGVLGFPSIEWIGLTIEASSCRTKTRAKSA
jgi:hypothetical protein